MVGSRDAPLAIPLIGANRRCTDKSQSSGQRRTRKRGPYPQKVFQSSLHFDSVLLTTIEFMANPQPGFKQACESGFSLSGYATFTRCDNPLPQGCSVLYMLRRRSER
jgi:hypothetical protein